MSVKNRVSHPVHTQLTDDTLEAYIAWREERAGVWRAYGRWSVASVDDVVSAFSAYQAALDREEKASWVYADLLARLENALQEGRPDRGRGSRHDVLT